MPISIENCGFEHVRGLSEHEITELFDISEPANDARWRNIIPSESAIVRQGIVAAQKLRQSHEDPGEAFLRGLAIGLTASRPIIESEVSD
jgi:hypothetical protein